MSADMIDTTGIDRAELFAGLYNRAKTQGMGILEYDPLPMSKGVAQEVLAKMTDVKGDQRTAYFDYYRGRVMKIEVMNDQLDPYLYDRDNGVGACAEVVRSLAHRDVV